MQQTEKNSWRSCTEDNQFTTPRVYFGHIMLIHTVISVLKINESNKFRIQQGFTSCVCSSGMSPYSRASAFLQLTNNGQPPFVANIYLGITLEDKEIPYNKYF